MDVGRSDLTAPSGRDCFLQAGTEEGEKKKKKQDGEIEHELRAGRNEGGFVGVARYS